MVFIVGRLYSANHSVPMDSRASMRDEMSGMPNDFFFSKLHFVLVSGSFHIVETSAILTNLDPWSIGAVALIILNNTLPTSNKGTITSMGDH